MHALDGGRAYREDGGAQRHTSSSVLRRLRPAGDGKKTQSEPYAWPPRSFNSERREATTGPVVVKAGAGGRPLLLSASSCRRRSLARGPARARALLQLQALGSRRPLGCFLGFQAHATHHLSSQCSDPAARSRSDGYRDPRGGR